MQTKHTPGPWRESIGVIQSKKGTLAYMVTQGYSGGEIISKDEAEANAKLIAVAPEQHEALKSAIDDMEQLLDFYSRECDEYDETKEEYETEPRLKAIALKSRIAKAKALIQKAID